MPGLSLTLRRDEISPELTRLASDSLRQRILGGIGTLMVSLSQRSFDEPSLRPAPWDKRKDKKPHPLLKRPSPQLWPSIHSQVIGDGVKFGTQVPYAGFLQMGTSRMVARPFFPVLNGELTGHAQEEIKDIVDALVGNV
jgi:phage gpG-like protein